SPSSWASMRRRSTIAEIEKDVRAEDQLTRSRAMEDLTLLVKREPSIHSAALGIFRTALHNPSDTLMTTSALHGLESVAGHAEARRAARALFSHPRAALVAAVALCLEHRSHVPALIVLLSQRSEQHVREAAIRTLGRLRDPAALAAILDCLPIAELRPHVVEALGGLV